MAPVPITRRPNLANKRVGQNVPPEGGLGGSHCILMLLPLSLMESEVAIRVGCELLLPSACLVLKRQRLLGEHPELR